MNITIAGTGYVGLVTGVCLSEKGHRVICYDHDEEKTAALSSGVPLIYEPGLEAMLDQNMKEGKLSFTSDPEIAYKSPECIFLAVGTPEKEDGSADLGFIYSACGMIADKLRHETIIAIKSTVPVGTNEKLRAFFKQNLAIPVHIVSNPEFLREGSGIRDTFQADRIIIGSDSFKAAKTVEEIYAPFSVPIIHMDAKSAELAKYASNAFLAAKISYINEMAHLCERMGANIDAVAAGMGLDKRIGSRFLQAGAGFGGSCFPKDTKALGMMAEEHQYEFRILKALMEVNAIQKKVLLQKAKSIMSLAGRNAAVLGLAFKPDTDDIREAPSIELIRDLVDEGASVSVYDPIASSRAMGVLPDSVHFAASIHEAIHGKDLAFITTEWAEIRHFPLSAYKEYMKDPLVLDGRNCYTLQEAESANIRYISIGRPECPARSAVFG
jgi:UDPglucose 6-dehydrogenase